MGHGNMAFGTVNHGIHHFAGWCASSGAKIVAGDFNGDRKADVACTGVKGWATAPIAYSLGNGQYSVTNNPIAHIAGWASTPGVKLLAGQFGGDKRADIALAGGHGWATLPTALSV